MKEIVQVIDAEIAKLEAKIENFRKARVILQNGDAPHDVGKKNGRTGAWEKIKNVLAHGNTVMAKDIRTQSGLTKAQVNNALQGARKRKLAKTSPKGWKLLP